MAVGCGIQQMRPLVEHQLIHGNGRKSSGCGQPTCAAVYQDPEVGSDINVARFGVVCDSGYGLIAESCTQVLPLCTPCFRVIGNLEHVTRRRGCIRIVAGEGDERPQRIVGIDCNTADEASGLSCGVNTVVCNAFWIPRVRIHRNKQSATTSGGP